MRLLGLLLFTLPLFAETPYFIRLWPASLVRGMGIPGVPDDAPDVIQIFCLPTRNDTAKLVVKLTVRRGDVSSVLELEQKRDLTSWTNVPLVVDGLLGGLELLDINIDEVPAPAPTVVTHAVAPLRVLR